MNFVYANTVGLLAAMSVAALSSATPAVAGEDMHDIWRDTIAHTPVPAEGGCFHAHFPSTSWTKVSCSTAAPRMISHPRAHRADTVGNGNDYAITTSTKISEAVGTFPTVTGVTSETDNASGGANAYTLQLNSGFMSGTSVCAGHSYQGTACQSWQQFVYESKGPSTVFIQTWLIAYGSKCPSGLSSDGEGDCWGDTSPQVSVPAQTIAQLAHLKLSGTAVSGGNDTAVLTTATDAYSAAAKDSTTDLASAWNSAEFNVVGNGGGTQAKFNNGASVTVQIAVTDGSTSAPTCTPDDGTTGETNNLKLGSCSTSGGSTPSIKFTESN